MNYCEAAGLPTCHVLHDAQQLGSCLGLPRSLRGFIARGTQKCLQNDGWSDHDVVVLLDLLPEGRQHDPPRKSPDVPVLALTPSIRPLSRCDLAGKYSVVTFRRA